MSNQPKWKYGQRLAVVDIVYIKEQHLIRTAAEIAAELGVPKSKVEYQVRKLKLPKQEVTAPNRRAMQAKRGAGDELDTPPRHEQGAGGTTAPQGLREGLVGPISPPSDMLVFVRSQPVRQAALALKLSRGQVHRIAQGYWPEDSRRTLAAWDAYRGRTDAPGSSWFLRRVLPGGTVLHARAHYFSASLAYRVGMLVAVARVADGGLLVQTLELPAQRFVLSRVEAKP